MSRDVVSRIQKFNQGRNPAMLALKYHAMRQDVFAFLRGTCHLFYQDWQADSPLNEAPAVWICGDLHLENFGSYRGGDRLIYFDINDFDEAVLAPCTWDLARFLTSVLVAADSLHIDPYDAHALCENFLTMYTTTLAKGQAGMINPETATGLVKELLRGLKQRKRKDFLHQRTVMMGKSRRLRLGEKALPVAPEKQAAIALMLKTWADQQASSKFFRLLDVAYRIAGTGSLGLERYILLVEGQGSPNRNALLDLKIARPSSLQPYLAQPQPIWKTQAERVVMLQTRVQWSVPALLANLELGRDSYVLRELQPTQDRLNLSQWNGKLRRLRKVIETMAMVTAWGQLLSGGRQGSAIADDLIAFAQNPQWHIPLLNYARDYTAQVKSDYQAFCEAKL